MKENAAEPARHASEGVTRILAHADGDAFAARAAARRNHQPCRLVYHVFSLRLRDVELFFAERDSSSPTKPFGVGASNSAGALPAAGGHGPETSGTLTRCIHTHPGQLRYLWRAVHQHGVVLDILVPGSRNTAMPKPISEQSRGRREDESDRCNS